MHSRLLPATFWLLLATCSSLAQTTPAEPAPPAPPMTAPAPTAPAAPATPSPAAERPEHGTLATVLSLEESDGVMGKAVRSAVGEDMGRIIDVIVSVNGQVRAAVIDFGGFLGVGTRKVAVDWRALQFANDGKTWRVTASLTRNQVRTSPEYKLGEPIVVLGAPPAPPREAAAPAPAPVPAPAPAPRSGAPEASAPAPTPAPTPRNGAPDVAPRGTDP